MFINLQLKLYRNFYIGSLPYSLFMFDDRVITGVDEKNQNHKLNRRPKLYLGLKPIYIALHYCISSKSF